MTDQNGKEYFDCIVGNIIGGHPWGEEKIIISGTKHFRAGAKVYCIFVYGSNGHEHVRVFGKPRNSFKMIDVVIRTSHLQNLRLQKVYDPKIIAVLREYQDSVILTTAEMTNFIKSLNAHRAETTERKGPEQAGDITSD